ncbi:MAG: class I SAM-dependent methyltransferase [Coriobacteriales bacterium]|nr:class I SAM-dependent methyltransferase [Coriobacteriales bacterium]
MMPSDLELAHANGCGPFAGPGPAPFAAPPFSSASRPLSQREFTNENRFYWTARSASYSSQNQHELVGARAQVWSRELLGPIEQTLGRRDPAQVRVLDIGCGPGIFSVLLAREGFAVTAIDYTPEMLKNARANAGQLARNIDWRFMDAQDLDFADGSFDVVVSRNVTWNLPDPLRAYRSWARVLAGGGVLVNFDASWYAYLFDRDDERRHRTRELVGSVGMDGSRVRTDVDAMERIALQAPLSSADRPVWDAEVLGALGFEVQVDRQVGKRVWTPHEQELFSATPLFKVVATRP